MDKKISRRIAIYNYIFVFVIVFYHAKPVLDPNLLGMDKLALCDSVIENVATLAMAFFFFVTQYLFFRDFSYSKYGKKITKRLKTLLLPYIVWNIIAIGIDYLRGINTTPLASFKTCFTFVFPPNGPIWYVYAIFILALFSPITYYLLKNKWVGLVLASVFAIGCSALCTTNVGFIQFLRSYGYLANIFTYLPSYVLGAYIGIHSKDMTWLKASLYFVCLVLLSYIVDYKFGGTFLRTILRVLPILFVYIAPCKEKGKDVQGSFFTYAAHGGILSFILDPIGRGITYFFSSALVVSLLTRIICTAIAGVAAYLVYRLIKFISPKLLVVFTGGR